MANQYGALAAPPPPNLGYGTRGEVPIDAVNQWMRSQPWYQDLLKSFGQNPNAVNLSDYQKAQVVKAAQAHGVVVDEGSNGQEVDDSGNFRATGHKLRNGLIVAGIAGAALLTAGAAGAFGGAAAGGGAAGTGAGAGTAAATGASTAATGAGVGTGAAVAGGGAAAATGVSSWLKPLLSVGVPVVGSIIGAKMQTDANKDAAAIQAKGLADALDFEKQQYADLTKRLDPYVQGGTTANDRMVQLLGLPQREGTTATAPPRYGPSVQPNTSLAGPAGPPSPGGASVVQPPAATGNRYNTNTPAPPSPEQPTAAEPLVALVAPSGETRQVPKSQVDFYISKGAKLAGATA